MQKEIQSYLLDSCNLKKKMSEILPGVIEQVAKEVVVSFQSGNKILVCGNGGSAADAQHFAAEFINRYKLNRQPLPAIALTTDTSALTSIGNDSSFDDIFMKQIQAIGERGDLLFVITTSDISFEPHGHSANLAKAITVAREKGMKIIGLVSQKSKVILQYLDLALIVPHTDTPRIQEGHITILHIICEIVEKKLFSSPR